MKSASGKYFIGLDHVRALAALIVFSWHFIGATDGHLGSLAIFPLSIITEGHTGVSLFMALSGYLFAKLLADKKIIYTAFIYNRTLRLLPLLIVVIIIVGIQKHLSGDDLSIYFNSILIGAIKPSLPNGAWSITTEFHFYLSLPLLLFLTNKWRYSLFVVLICAVTFRFFLHQQIGEVQSLSYWTIIGRIDQFLLGILAFNFRHLIAGKHLLAAVTFIVFSCFYWYFDNQGGFFESPSYPSPSSIWIYLPTMEGLFYAFLISWYDNSFKHSNGKLSSFFATIGTYSYSIYLLHFFVVFRLAKAIDQYVIDLSNIYINLITALLAFVVMVPIGHLSYKFIESPFLRFRSNYTTPK